MNRVDSGDRTAEGDDSGEAVDLPLLPDGATVTEGESGAAPSGNGTADASFVERLRGSVRRLTGWGVTEGDLYDPSELEPFSQEQNPDLLEHPTVTEVVADVREYFERAEDLPFEQTPDPELLATRFFDFGYLEEYEEIERKWVNEPFAYVSVVYDREEKEHRYHVAEPRLDEFEEFVLDELRKILRNSLMYQDIEEGDREQIFMDRSAALISKHTAAMPPRSIYKALYYLKRDFIGYDKIDAMLRDDAIEDISCDGIDVPVFVYHKEYRDLDTNVVFGDEELTSFVPRLAQRSGKHISVSNPLVDASLPDGSRIQLSFGGDISMRGPNFTIRQFTPVPDSPIDLIKWETFTVEQMAYFWLAIENNASLIFAGGTGSGKTTSLNAVSFFIPKKAKIVTIEDTAEISLPHENWIQSLTRDAMGGSDRGEVTMYQQLQSSLRQRPEYILVGEIRTESPVALTFFQAMATGHSAYTTIHAESVMGIINRLENEPLSVPTQLIKELDIISIQRQVMLGGARVRRNDRIVELVSTGSEAGDIHINSVFEWDPTSDSYNVNFDSNVFEEIAADRGWSERELQEAYEERRQVLQYLVDEDIQWWEDVARVIHGYMNDPDRVMRQIEEDRLDPTAIASV
ncbi:MAG: type II/IV secretion system ATPase subunit [Halodesulfurarchaeum sp.]